MKYLFIFFALMFSMMTHQDIFAITYKQDIPTSQNPISPNTQSNVNRAQLLEVHIGNFIKNITDTSKKYGLEKEKTISDSLKITSVMKDKVMQIQTRNIEEAIAETVLTSIVEDLKKINHTIKQYFHEQVDNIEDYHEKYGNAASKIARQLDILTLKLQTKIKAKDQINARDQQILRHSFKLEKISTNLKNFKNIEFYKKSEIRSSMIRIIKEIKKEIQKLRDL